MINNAHAALTSSDTTIRKQRARFLSISVENGSMLGNGTELGEQIRNSSVYSGLDIRLGFKKGDKHVYASVYRFPMMGIGFYASTFHNASIGNPNALYFFFQIPFARREGKRLSFDYLGTLGLSYNFNPFDSIDNPENIFIGTYHNAYVHLGLLANYKISERWTLSSTLGFKHFSNGAFRRPNSGINLIPLAISTTYRLSPADVHMSSPNIPSYQPHGLLNVSLSTGPKQYRPGERQHMKGTLSISFLRQTSYKYRIGAGLDIFYAGGAEDRFLSGEHVALNQRMSLAAVGVWEWALSRRVYVPINIGVYLHRNIENEETNWFYQRVGMRYRFTNHLFTGLTLKAHKGVADFFEWTLGYAFYRERNTY